MGRYNSDDFGYGFASKMEEEQQPLVAASSKSRDDKNTGLDIDEPSPCAQSDQGGNEYNLYEEQGQQQQEAYRFQPAKYNRGGESFLASDDNGSAEIDPITCMGSICCCVTISFIISGGVLLSIVKYKESDPKVLIGSILLVVAAGTCLCSCAALCIGPSVSRSNNGDAKADPHLKETKVRFRRLNDRYEKGCIAGENRLQRIRLDVVGHMKEIKEAARKEAKEKKETQKKNLDELEKRVKKDIEAGIPVKTIRQQYRPVVFYIIFNGDVFVSDLELFRKQISLVVNLARPGHDQCCVAITSPGGSVTQYGLAASQLVRIRKAGIRLTACVDSIAASGGYMMASVANQIYAAPFAIVGSIGVVTQIPNFQRFLNEHKVDAYLMTAGKHKRTIDIIGDVTEEGKAKLSEELDDVHIAFKDHVALARPKLQETIEEVGTGEHWLAVQAKDKGLVDEIMTSDEYLESVCEKFDIIEILEKKEISKSQQIAGLFGGHLGTTSRRVKSVIDQFQSAVEAPGKSNAPMAIM